MKETETFHVHVTARVCASTCAGIDFRLMVRVLETSGVRKKFKYQRRPYSSREMGWNNRKITTLSLGPGSTTSESKLVITNESQ